MMIGVAGAGLMGTGIVAVFAAAGLPVVLFDPDAAARLSAATRLRKLAAEIPGERAMQVAIVDSLSGLADVGLVIEAAPEVEEVKRRLYRELFAALNSGAIVASNTSSFPPDQLAIGLGPDEARRFLVAHFWNPPHLLPLVELVAGTATDPDLVARLRTLLIDVGLRPVVLDRAMPGFIGNRLQFAVMREALHIVEAGYATAEAVDEVMRFSLGRRYSVQGPFESADLGGIQVFLKVAEQLFPNLASATEGIDTLATLVEAQRLGARSGRGFYEWTDDRREAVAKRWQSLARRTD